MLRSIVVLAMFVLGLLLSGCGPAKVEPAKPAPAAAGPIADTVDPKDAIGKCAADIKDGFVYGKILAIEVAEDTGNKMVKIAGEGAAIWNKNAKNIRVVECK